jgi:hypothetical protein
MFEGNGTSDDCNDDDDVNNDSDNDDDDARSHYQTINISSKF